MIAGLLRYFSLAVVRALVAAGYGLPSLTVVGASATTPVVLEMAAPHNVNDSANGFHVVVDGVGGVPAANGLFVALPTDATHLALYVAANDSDALTPVAGAGTYTTGGTVTTALTDGRILVGRQHIAEQSFAPRIVFVPREATFGNPGISAAMNKNGFPQTDVQNGWLGRPLATEVMAFEVHVWGCASPPDPEYGDYDATRLLYNCVLQQAQLLASSRWATKAGGWADQAPGATQLLKAGHEFVFGLTLATPIFDVLQRFVQTGTVGTLVINLSNGEPSDAVTLQVPQS